MTAPGHDAAVDDVLRRLTAQLRRRDIDGVLALFHSDGIVLGSEQGEQAIGQEQLREFLKRLFSRPHTYGWADWCPMLTGGSEQLLWFVAPATVVTQDDAGVEQRGPYRLSGVLERDGEEPWRFRLFNGAEPVSVPEAPADPAA